MKKQRTENAMTLPKGQYTLKQMQIMTNTIIEQLKRRQGGLGLQYADKRDIYDVLGYSKEPQPKDYWNYFLREDIAKRIVLAPVKALWRKPPTICETDNPDRDTAFEKAWDELVKKYHVWSYFSRADKLAGIGRYGVLLMGLPGGKLDEEVRAGTGAGQKLLFLSAYSERTAAVETYYTDRQNERFGRPEFYKIDISGDLSGSKIGRAAINTERVHQSRVLHFADELLEDEVHGTPRLEAVFNRLYDLQKVIGGSAEGYWRAAYGGFALEADKDSTSAFSESGQVDPTLVDEWSHGMRRWIDLQGYKMTKIDGQDFKPKEVFEVICAAISAATGIPQRILLGSERGQLASSQDEINWKDYVEERRNEYADPLIRDFIGRLVKWNILPAPKQDYKIDWPTLYSKTDEEKAKEFGLYADGISKLAPGAQPELIISPAEVRTKFLDMEPETAEDMKIDPLDIAPEETPATP